MTPDEIEEAEMQGKTVYQDDGNGWYVRAYPDFQTCDICHNRLPIADLKCMCEPPIYWCKKCTLEREAREFPNSTMKVTV